jgi:hypothetical protein
MAGRGRGRSIGLALAALLAACGGPDGEAGQGGLRLSFEDRAEPAAFAREGLGVRDRPGGAAGLWAAVRGLPRPERAEVTNPVSGASVVVALFAAGPSAPDIRLSNAAADALGIGARPAPVRITALRSEPVLDTTPGRF